MLSQRHHWLAIAVMCFCAGGLLPAVRAPSPFHKQTSAVAALFPAQSAIISSSNSGSGSAINAAARPPFAGPNNAYRGPNPATTVPLGAVDPHAPFPAASLRDVAAAHELHSVFAWRTIDFAYPTPAARQRALADGTFVPANNVPLGVDRHGERVFVTLPRWKGGIPASLAWLPLPTGNEAGLQGPTEPPMRPYPSWQAHGDPLRPDCAKLMSVYRLWVDECERLWVIDAGVVNATIAIRQVCPPKIVAFDLRTDQQLFSHQLPADQVLPGSLHTNIVVDVRPHAANACAQAHAYVTDVWRYGVTVFSLAAFRSWRTSHHLYWPTPPNSDYTLHGLNFQWTDGVFGVSLGPVVLQEPAHRRASASDRHVFFHPMSSQTEFAVSAAVLQNETLWTRDGGAGAVQSFRAIGTRGSDGQSSTAGLDAGGVQFFTLVLQDAIGCWDTRRAYDWQAVGVVARDNRTLHFPNDLKIDRPTSDGEEQSVWVLSNRLPVFLYSQLDASDVNFRIQRIGVREAVRGTACDGWRNAQTVGGPYGRLPDEYDEGGESPRAQSFEYDD